MSNKCYISKGNLLGFGFLVSHEDSVREMTINHPPQREERDSRTSQLP